MGNPEITEATVRAMVGQRELGVPSVSLPV